MSNSSAPAWTLYTERQRWGFLAVLFLVSTSNYLDRNVVSVLLEPIKHEFRVSDTMLGLLSGFCFAVFYATFGMPVARWADRGNRRTIITLALSVWSAMTMICGLTHSFWQLLLARVGVGAGESGAIPPAQSLIVDYFPPERRATSIAIFTSASTAGYLLGIGAGGYIAAELGWRAAMLLVGAPGLLLAAIVRLTLPEPRLRSPGVHRDNSVEPLMHTLRVLWNKRSFRYALAGCLFYFLLGYGAFLFIPSFLVRVLHEPLVTASVVYGSVTAGASLLGTLSGGWLADRLGRADIRWLAWLPAVACALTTPLFMLAFAAQRLWSFMAVAFVGLLLLTGGLPPVFAAIHAVCGNARRAVAIALVFFSATLFGGGVGPLTTGALSDALAPLHGADSLRYALIIMTTLLLASAALFYCFGRALPADLEP